MLRRYYLATGTPQRTLYERNFERTIRRLGWTPDLPDHRDHLYAAPPLALASLPAKVDLRPFCPPIYNQGRIGSSVANAVAAAIQYDRLRGGRTPDFVPSRLFLYFNARRAARHIPFDSGASLRDAIKAATKAGICPETEWPYDDTPAPYDGGPFPTESRAGQTPSENCYEIAEQFRVSQYQRVAQNLNQLKGCLASGFPYVFGFTVFESFVDESGKLHSHTPMPAPGENAVGGHAALGVGFDDAKQAMIVRNSWGANEGDEGCFYLPYAYITDSGFARDFWTIRTISY